MIHGLLHLMGYGDKSEDQISLMREKEEYYIAKFDLFLRLDYSTFFKTSNEFKSLNPLIWILK